MGVDEDEFSRFVVSRWPALVRLAWLMVGALRHADEVVVAALVQVRGDWDRVTSEEAPFAFTRAAVLATAQSRTRERRIEEARLALPRHTQRATGAVEDRANATAEDTATDDPEQLEERRLQVRRALLDLPSRTRAVTLLRWAEQLGPGEVATVLAVSPALVSGEQARGVGALHAALKNLPCGDGDPEEVVRSALVDVVGSAPDAPSDPLARIEQSGRAQRRRRQRITGAVAAALVALLAVPAGFGAYDRPPGPAPSPTIDAASWDDPSTWPTRGSLSGDAALIAEVKQAHGSTNALYAGVVQDRTVVLLWNRATQSLEGYKGPVGVATPELQPVGRVIEYGSVFGSDPAFAVAVTDLNRGTLVLLGTPGLGPVEVSTAVQLEADGTAGREWSTVRTLDGTASTELETTSIGLVRVQTVDGHIPLEVLPVTSDEPIMLDDCLECGSSDPAVSFAAQRTFDTSRLLDIPVEDLRTSVRYAGSVDSRLADLPASATDPEISEDGAGGALVVVHTTLPNGAVLRSAQISSTNSREETYVSELEQAVPIDASTVGDALGLSARVDDRSYLQVFARAGTALAVIDSAGRPVTRRVSIRDGSAVVPLPSPQPANLVIVTYDARGRAIGDSPIELLGERPSLLQ